MKKILKYSVIYALVLFAYRLLVVYVFKAPMGGQIQDIVGLIFTLLFFYWVGIQYKKEAPRKLYFGDLFLPILLCISCSFILHELICAFHELITPSVQYDLLEYRLKNAEMGIFGRTPEQILDSQIRILEDKDMFNSFKTFNPEILLSLVFITFALAFVLGLLLSRNFIDRWHKITYVT